MASRKVCPSGTSVNMRSVSASPSHADAEAKWSAFSSTAVAGFTPTARSEAIKAHTASNTQPERRFSIRSGIGLSFITNSRIAQARLRRTRRSQPNAPAAPAVEFLIVDDPMGLVCERIVWLLNIASSSLNAPLWTGLLKDGQSQIIDEARTSAPNDYYDTCQTNCNTT